LLTRLGPFTAKYYGDGVAIIYEWRGDFTTAELNGLHAEAFETRISTSPNGTGSHRYRDIASGGLPPGRPAECSSVS
jgi:hypothetical protein